MIRKLLILGCVQFLAQSGFPQDCIDKEQFAFNYFVDSLLEREFENAKFIFTGKVSKEYTDFQSFRICFDGDSELYDKIKTQAYYSKNDLNEKKDRNKVKVVDENKRSFFKVKGRGKRLYEVNLYRATTLSDMSYVQVRIKKYPKIRDFYIEIDDKKREVTRWCEQGLIY